MNEATQSVSISAEYKGVKAIITFRDIDVEMKDLVIKCENGIDWMLERNWTPERKGFGAKKEIEYVKDQSGAPLLCPMCKVGHVKVIHSAKGTFYGCDTSKFDPLTKTYGGCKYFSTTDPSKTPQLKQEDLDVPEDF